MGLGPPVCTKCRVLCRLQDGGSAPWLCPSCKGLPISNLWELPISEQREYEENTKLYRFLTWQEPKHAPVNK